MNSMCASCAASECPCGQLVSRVGRVDEDRDPGLADSELVVHSDADVVLTDAETGCIDAWSAADLAIPVAHPPPGVWRRHAGIGVAVQLACEVDRVAARKV